MAPNKCNYIFFSQANSINSNQLILKLYNTQITKVESTKFLGITLDQKLNFNKHIEQIKNKTLGRSNIIKILSHKKWKLSGDTLLKMYKSLVRSIIEYSDFIYPFLSAKSKNTLNIIENNCLRFILGFKRSDRISIDKLHELTKVEKLEERISKIRTSYLESASQNNNPLIEDLVAEFNKFKGARKLTFPTSL